MAQIGRTSIGDPVRKAASQPPPRIVIQGQHLFALGQAGGLDRLPDIFAGDAQQNTVVRRRQHLVLPDEKQVGPRPFGQAARPVGQQQLETAAERAGLGKSRGDGRLVVSPG